MLPEIVLLNSRPCTSSGQELGHVFASVWFFLMFCKHLTTKTAKPFGHLGWITFNQLMWANVSTHSHSEMLAAKPGMFCHRDEWLNVVMISWIHSTYSDSGFFLWRWKLLPLCSLGFFDFQTHGNALLLRLLCLTFASHRTFISRRKGKTVCGRITDQVPLVSGQPWFGPNNTQYLKTSFVGDDDGFSVLVE